MDEWFLEPFPRKERRQYLTDRLQNYLGALKSLDVRIVVWIDGSFVTYKEAPEDIDLLLLVDEAIIQNLSGGQALLFRSLISDRPLIRSRFDCDVYFTSPTDASDLATWQKRFGQYLHSSDTKGIFTLTFNAHAPTRPNGGTAG